MLHKRTKQRNTEEYRFLHRFLDSGYFNKYNRGNYNITLIQEPFTLVGYADLVCVRWRKPSSTDWKERRNNLKKTDIQILHHLYNCKIFKNSEEIVMELGFSMCEVNNVLQNLYDSGLIIENKKKNKVKIGKINDIFFIKEIIAIEAKLKDWKGALRQSFNNISFASQSISLLPEKTISNNLIKNYRKTGIGVLSFGDTYSEIIKPKKMKIPTNIISWYFNEFIWRTCCLTC